MPRKITEVMQDMGLQPDGAFWTSGLHLWNEMSNENLWRVCVYGLKYDTNGKDWTVDESNVMWFTENERKG